VSLLVAPAKAELTFIIDGGGEEITTGEKGHLRVPFNCIIDRVTLTADQEGWIGIDIWKSTYAAFPPAAGDSITGGNPPGIQGADKYEDTDLTGWSRSLNEGDILAFATYGASEITRVTINLHVRKR
jgi:hypothetical protein